MSYYNYPQFHNPFEFRPQNHLSYGQYGVSDLNKNSLQLQPDLSFQWDTNNRKNNTGYFTEPQSQEGVFQINNNSPIVSPETAHTENNFSKSRLKKQFTFEPDFQKYFAFKGLNNMVNSFASAKENRYQENNYLNNMNNQAFDNNRSENEMYGYGYGKMGGSIFKRRKKMQDGGLMDDTDNLLEEELQKELQAEIDAENIERNEEEIAVKKQEEEKEVKKQRSQYINDLIYGDDFSNIGRKEKTSTSNNDNTVVASTKVYAQAPKLRDYLLQKGLTKEAAAGVLGNIEAESAFNSGVAGDQGQSYGLFQHYRKRKENLLRYAKNKGKDTHDPYMQIDFALQERPDIVAQINRAKTPQEAADIWVRKFEIPVNIDYQSKLRQKLASKYYQVGGTYTIDEEELEDLKRQGYNYKITE